MARTLRAPSLSLKLDVIVEEDPDNLVDNIGLPNEHSFPSTQSTPIGTTCTVTLRNFHLSNANDPQFLHTGRWPSMDMVDTILESTPRLQTSHRSEKSNNTHALSLLRRDNVDMGVSLEADTKTWGVVTAEQVSMVMDHWNPDEGIYPCVDGPALTSYHHSSSMSWSLYGPVTTAQHSLFLREVMDEHVTRVQTVEHIEELEDNDSAIEIVATLEGYRQNGWAEEMIQAFPRECWLFWTNSGINRSIFVDHADGCDGWSFSSFGETK